MKKIMTCALISLSALALPVTPTYAAHGPWHVRLRGLGVNPSVSSSTISTIGGKVYDISTEYVPELDFSYFARENIAFELILAASRHQVNAHRTLLDGTSGSKAGKTELGSVSVLPPTLTAQYHFRPGTTCDPYLGGGLNYTNFFNEDASSNILSISYKNSFNGALQAGVDVALQDNWSLNFDVKKIFIDSKVSLRSLGNTKVRTSVNIDPTVFGIGIGYRY